MDMDILFNEIEFGLQRRGDVFQARFEIVCLLQNVLRIIVYQ